MKTPSDFAQDDLHFRGNPQQIAGMEKGACCGDCAKSGGSCGGSSSMTPGSIFDEEDVMSQIYHVLGMVEDDEEDGSLGMEEAPALG